MTCVSIRFKGTSLWNEGCIQKCQEPRISQGSSLVVKVIISLVEQGDDRANIFQKLQDPLHFHKDSIAHCLNHFKGHHVQYRLYMCIKLEITRCNVDCIRPQSIIGVYNTSIYLVTNIGDMIE